MNLHDYRRFSAKLNSRKLINITKLYYSYRRSLIRNDLKISGLPMTVSIEPTTACNLRCPECPSGLRNFSRPTGNLKSDFFRSLIKEIHDHLIYLIFYFQGEPYINPNFLDMVHYAHRKNIYTITSTNGHFLNDNNARSTVESGLDRLIISIDGTTQEVYQSYRREGSLQSVIDGANNIVKWKKKLGKKHPYVIFQFLVVKPNEHQISDVFRIADEIGVNEVKLKTAQIYDFINGNPLIPDNEVYSRYSKQSDGTYRIKNKLVNECWKMWHSCVVTWDGKVVPCCFDKDARHELGDLTNDSLKDIWQGQRYHYFRKKLFEDRTAIDICQNCTEGCKVNFNVEV